jgi:hypothetical protein
MEMKNSCVVLHRNAKLAQIGLRSLGRLLQCMVVFIRLRVVVLEGVGGEIML